MPSAVSAYRDSPTPQNATLLQELYHLIHRIQVHLTMLRIATCIQSLLIMYRFCSNVCRSPAWPQRLSFAVYNYWVTILYVCLCCTCNHAIISRGPKQRNFAYEISWRFQDFLKISRFPKIKRFPLDSKITPRITLVWAQGYNEITLKITKKVQAVHQTLSDRALIISNR